MHLPEEVQGPMRNAVERWLGTSRLAIHLRLVGAVGLLALTAVLHGHTSLRADSLWVATSVAWIVLIPRLLDLERLYGHRIVTGAVFALIVGVPLVFALVFSAFVCVVDPSSYRDANAYWIMKIVCGALALAGWWAVFRAVRMCQEISRQLHR